MSGNEQSIANHVADDVVTRGTAELIDDLLTIDHAYLREALPIIEQLASRVAQVHGAREEDLVSLAVTVMQFSARVSRHLDDEAERLFPALLGPADPADLRAAVAASADDHHALMAWIARMRTLADDFRPPEWACDTHRALFAELAAIERTIAAHVLAEEHLATRFEDAMEVAR